MSNESTNPNTGNTNSGKPNGNGKALTRVDQLKAGFEQWRPTLKAVLPRHIDPERVIKIAMNVYLNKPELQACTPVSMIKATIQCAELGLEPSPLLGEAWFLPFENKKKVKDGNVWKEMKVLEVQLLPGYVGLIKLGKQTGDVSDIYAVVVDECDRTPEFDATGRLIAGFHREEGTDRRIRHVPRMDQMTGKLYAVYGVVKFKDGTNHFEVLTKADVEAIRARSKAKDNGPWVTDYNAMAKKTAIKQALKTVPKSPERPALADALRASTSVDLGEAFSSDLSDKFTDAIDTEGTPVEEPTTPGASKPASRNDDLSAKLDANAKPAQQPMHDPKTGEVLA